MRDSDEQVRATAVRVLGDNRVTDAERAIVKRMYDESPHVQSLAALAAARLRTTRAADALIDLASQYDNADAIVRHAAATGMAGCLTDAALEQLADHERLAVRLSAVLAARQKRSPVLVEFLDDTDETIVTEAARAIYDLPLYDLFSQLAQLVKRPLQSDAALRRALAAQYRLGQADHADHLAAFAADSSRLLPLRLFAVSLLAAWESTSQRDVVLGMWRPRGENHIRADVVAAVKQHLAGLMNGGSEIRNATARLAARLGIAEAEQYLRQLLWDHDRPGKERAGFLLALAALEPGDMQQLCEKAITDDQPRVRAAGRIVLARLQPAAVMGSLGDALRNGTELEKQSAVAVLADIGQDAADARLTELLRAVRSDALPAFLTLDVVSAAERRSPANPELATELAGYRSSLPTDDSLAPYRPALQGGNAERGGRLFVQRNSLGCVRCHQVDGRGGAVGPDLTHVATRLTRDELLESILQPSQSISKGYETQVLTLASGRIVTGIVQEKNDREWVLLTADERTIRVPLEEVEETSHGQSAMPTGLVNYLTPFDLRDLIEYLASLK